MPKILQDPLLGTARVILLFFMGVMGLAGVAALIALPLVLFNREKIVLAIAEETSKMPGTETVPFIAGLLALLIVLVALLFFFLRHMKRIVDSVASGDPFIPQNANRLTAMAWLMLAVQVIVFPLAGLAIFFAETMGEEIGTADAGVNLNGIVLVITLFILARVFRKGTEMREELEGTV